LQFCGTVSHAASRFESLAVYNNKGSTGSSAPAGPIGELRPVESQIDLIAATSAIDPLEFRLRMSIGGRQGTGWRTLSSVSIEDWPAQGGRRDRLEGSQARARPRKGLACSWWLTTGARPASM